VTAVKTKNPNPHARTEAQMTAKKSAKKAATNKQPSPKAAKAKTPDLTPAAEPVAPVAATTPKIPKAPKAAAMSKEALTALAETHGKVKLVTVRDPKLRGTLAVVVSVLGTDKKWAPRIKLADGSTKIVSPTSVAAV